ncbi:PaaI family thioesterase [Amycolatopsis acidicola]|uniref:PaaI family thioesterase n=1 Tax=Amycolatopsis acidicola TaxID=2596893 RepID=A0A5N0VDR0_9PSEU|nr:PaaI family thioesterase [Amycolatopsis acidicola]KAA9163310.1 PaaI family thioesterase [Amycolatopsis acidicola]
MRDLAGAVAGLDTAIRAALGSVRNGASHFYANFGGLSYDEIGDGRSAVLVAASPQALTEDGEFAEGIVAMMFDLALAAAVRSVVGKERRFPTVSLKIEYLRHPVRAEKLVCRAATAHRIGDLAAADARLETEDGRLVALATGRFLLLRPKPGTGFPLYPWESDPPRVLDFGDLSPLEREIRSFLLADIERWTTTSGVHRQIHRIDVAGSDGRAEARQPVGPHLANRNGNVQGGILTGLLGEACAHAARTSDPELSLVSLQSTFLRPGMLSGSALAAKASTVFTGRRLACVSGEVFDDSGECLVRGEALFTASGRPR